MITTWIITILSIGLGYVLAEFKNNPQEVKDTIKRIRFKKPLVGAIHRPTAEEVNKRGTKLEETERIMDETFAKISNVKP